VHLWKLWCRLMQVAQSKVHALMVHCNSCDSYKSRWECFHVD